MIDVDRTRAGLAAVARCGAEQGLPVDDLRVLSARGNLVVHLAPSAVVARAATLTAWTRRDPFAWLAREVAVAGHAARRGGPVVPPTSAADPGPHRVEGTAVSLWEFRAVTTGRAAGRELGESLAALHAAIAGYPGALPVLAPVTEQIDDALHVCERDRILTADVLLALRRRHTRVRAELDGAGSAPIVLHGDAHAGNLLSCPDGPLWTDLEETCAGPPEWDLAVLTGGDGDPVALEAYAAARGAAVTREEQLAPFRRARELEAVVWLAVLAHVHPARYREPAGARLAALLATDDRSPRT